jgi:hypothetical protein
MTAITDLGVDDVNDESGNKAATSAPATTPQEPDQPDTPTTTGGVRPHESGAPYVHVVTEDQA